LRTLMACGLINKVQLNIKKDFTNIWRPNPFFALLYAMIYHAPNRIACLAALTNEVYVTMNWLKGTQQSLIATTSFLNSHCLVPAHGTGTLLDLQVRELRTCQCGASTRRDHHEPMIGFAFNTTGGTTLSNCILKYFKNSSESESESKCPACKHESCRKLSRQLLEVPDAFYAQANRFIFDPAMALVPGYVGQLDDSPLTLAPTIDLPFESRGVPFTLVAVAFFSGSSLKKGHWTATTLDRPRSDTHQWAHYNDLQIDMATFPRQTVSHLPCQFFFVRSSLLLLCA
jgi:hypothetical protein